MEIIISIIGLWGLFGATEIGEYQIGYILVYRTLNEQKPSNGHLWKGKIIN